jgi:hypothetical protein
MPLTRFPSTAIAVILNGAAISNAISMADFSGGLLIFPAAWTAAAAAFKVCSTPGGTFVPLRDQSGAIVEITNIQTAAAGAYPLPDELFGSMYFQVWSENAGAGTDAAQGADRSIGVVLKG